MEAIKSVFADAMKNFAASPAMQRIASGEFEIKHYQAYLRETYFYTRENPQIQAQAAVQFRGADRDLVKMFFRHASQEIGHDQLALNDFEALGGTGIESIKCGYPLPTTVPLIAFPYFQIQHRNPIGYLGYLFFLEFMPTGSGRNYMTALAQRGIPIGAMTFIREHTEIDVAHNKLMEEYAAHLIRTEADFLAVIYSLKVTGTLYAAMINGAFDQADSPSELGIDWLEARGRSAIQAVQAAAE